MPITRRIINRLIAILFDRLTSYSYHIISRVLTSYYFLLIYCNELERKYNMNIPFMCKSKYNVKIIL